MSKVVYNASIKSDETLAIAEIRQSDTYSMNGGAILKGFLSKKQMGEKVFDILPILSKHAIFDNLSYF